jgi:hypothetical protein
MSEAAPVSFDVNLGQRVTLLFQSSKDRDVEAARI